MNGQEIKEPFNRVLKNCGKAHITYPGRIEVTSILGHRTTSALHSLRTEERESRNAFKITWKSFILFHRQVNVLQVLQGRTSIFKSFPEAPVA